MPRYGEYLHLPSPIRSQVRRNTAEYHIDAPGHKIRPPMGRVVVDVIELGASEHGKPRCIQVVIGADPRSSDIKRPFVEKVNQLFQIVQRQIERGGKADR